MIVLKESQIKEVITKFQGQYPEYGLVLKENPGPCICGNMSRAKKASFHSQLYVSDNREGTPLAKQGEVYLADLYNQNERFEFVFRQDSPEGYPHIPGIIGSLEKLIEESAGSLAR